jgi:hypothetical protein
VFTCILKKSLRLLYENTPKGLKAEERLLMRKFLQVFQVGDELGKSDLSGVT